MKKQNLSQFAVPVLLVLGVLLRLYRFGAVPGGLNQDEAFAAYDAWCLLTSGMDSAGYRFPVYLSAWGSGMNALESYLMLPFLALFGAEAWVVRLPQLLVGCLSLWVTWDLTRRMAGERLALCFLGLLALCPWHIMLSRWALESNLAPGFVLFGLYFFVRGLEDRRWLPLSGLLYGLSLYAYAAIWPIMPPLLLFQILYCRKKLSLNASSLLALLLLALLALPLLLFLAVNHGLMEEIRGGLLSVPRMLTMRASEVSLQNIPENLKNLGNILLRQTDGLYWNHAGPLGILYPLTLPLALLGLAASIPGLCRKEKRARLEGLMLLWLTAAIVQGALVHVNVNRGNLLFLPILFFAACGLKLLWEKLGKLLPLLTVPVYALMLLGFGSYYFGEFADTIPYYFNAGLDTALEAAGEQPGTVYLDDSVYYSQVLFHARTDPERFRETVVYKQYPATYLSARSFDRFVFGLDSSQPDPEGLYILRRGRDADALAQAGYHLEEHGVYLLAYKEEIWTS